jgi:hypothetical protein
VNIITLTPPWGSLIAAAALRPDLGKHTETRGWALPAHAVGVPLAIHQAAGLPQGFSEEELTEICAEPAFRMALAVLGIARPDQLPRGKIVAVVTPLGSYPTCQIYASDAEDEPLDLRTGYINKAVFTQVSDADLAFGNYGFRRFAWPLDQIRALLQPLPYRGAQGLRRLPAEAQVLVEAQLL